jgi:hypothetical protein
MEMDRMEAELTAMANALTYPPTPDLSAAFWRRLQDRRQARELAPAWGLAGAGLAAAIVAFSVIIGTIAPARDAAADIFDRINLFHVDESAFEGITRDIEGEEVTLIEAEQRLGQNILIPRYPEGIEDTISRIVYRQFPPSANGVVAVFFEPEGGTPFVLFATNASLGKGLSVDATAEAVTLHCDLPALSCFNAYWIEGMRLVTFYDEDLQRVRDLSRVTEANSLIWTLSSHPYRIEGELERDEAIAIAESVR